MRTNQLSILLPNRAGELKKVLDVFKKESIQLIATTIADTVDYGVYRVICSNPKKACMALGAAGFTVTQTDVLAIELSNLPGTAARAVSAVSDSGVNIIYLYSFVLEGKGVLVMKVDDSEKATKAVVEAGFQMRSL